jgi:hypothetical protein
MKMPKFRWIKSQVAKGTYIARAKGNFEITRVCAREDGSYNISDTVCGNYLPCCAIVYTLEEAKRIAEIRIHKVFAKLEEAE